MKVVMSEIYGSMPKLHISSIFCKLCAASFGNLANYFASAYWVSWEMNLTKLQETKKEGATEKCNTIETTRFFDVTFLFTLSFL